MYCIYYKIQPIDKKKKQASNGYRGWGFVSIGTKRIDKLGNKGVLYKDIVGEVKLLYYERLITSTRLRR